LAFSKIVVQRSNINSAVNIACKLKCYISKSKSFLSECNDLGWIGIACIAFALHEIKQPGFYQFLKRITNSISCISLNIACKFKCKVLYIKIWVSPFWMQWSLFHSDSFYSFYVTWNQTVSRFFGTPGIGLVNWIT
jgi:hypothetical protein